ncbi:DUF1822 family protein [Pseudanabaenaceae cyanobacterium LEGE 13415]|nr:DUF1822 family protein [Pseudanabaenaceae cyanobacterium LEGE 13415]
MALKIATVAQNPKIMCANTRKSSISKFRIPQPGEIWQLTRSLNSPIEFPEARSLYSKVALEFLEQPRSRYVMIVREPESEQVTVMVLSDETQYISNIDLLIPAHLSRLAQDLLAETWNVLPMLTGHLDHAVGKRLSRPLYDVLLDVGDRYYGLTESQPDSSEIQKMGLNIGSRSTQESEVQEFHQREQAWNEVLSVPLSLYQTHLNAVKYSNALIIEAMQLEQLQIEQSPPIQLKQWLQGLFEPYWQAVSSGYQTAPLAIATRTKTADPNEIPTLLDQLESTTNEHQRHRVLRRLGEVAIGNEAAIRAIVQLLQTTTNDETLWSTIESLRLIDPNNPAIGVRRMRQIDWGVQIGRQAIAFVVSLVPRADQRTSILLQAYSMDQTCYLPLDLKLILLGKSGEPLREVKARSTDVCIQLKLSGEMGESFSVCLQLGSASIVEDFVL